MLRGRFKRVLIVDLAAGDQTYEDLAPRYGRSLQAVKEFSARNVAEIEGRRRI